MKSDKLFFLATLNLHQNKIQKTEDRRQKTEDRRQKTEDRRQKTEDRRQKTEDRRRRASPLILKIGVAITGVTIDSLPKRSP
ncbi:DUF874 family protein [Escherichia coli]|nr:DUF874 family protein [Escherichia coli]